MNNRIEQDDDLCTYRPDMMSFGYQFAKNFGGPFPKNELIEDLKFYTKVIFNTVQRYGGEEKYIDFMINEMLKHKIILQDGSKFVWNPDYRPSDEDVWSEFDCFKNSNEDGEV